MDAKIYHNMGYCIRHARSYHLYGECDSCNPNWYKRGSHLTEEELKKKKALIEKIVKETEDIYQRGLEKARKKNEEKHSNEMGESAGKREV